MDFVIRPMSMRDYDACARLWRGTPGVGFGKADSREGVRRYLRRNRGLSFVATFEGAVVGALLAGHDGRRGSLNHLAVAEAQRRRGIGKALVEAALGALRAAGIEKCTIVVFRRNRGARRFYEAQGWTGRLDLHVMSKPL
jgi:ribosomal protein S18 acetylase RimI-like enzyme